MGLYPRLYQDVRQNQLDGCCQGLSKLLQDQLFLTSMVHALEEQKSFTIKDKSVSLGCSSTVTSVPSLSIASSTGAR